MNYTGHCSYFISGIPSAHLWPRSRILLWGLSKEVGIAAAYVCMSLHHPFSLFKSCLLEKPVHLNFSISTSTYIHVYVLRFIHSTVSIYVTFVRGSISVN